MIPPRAVLLLLAGCLSLPLPSHAQMSTTAPQGVLSARIVNGVLTEAYPTAGALVAPADPDRAELVCSGTMIGCRTFLTAAHCVCDFTGGDCPSAELDSSDYLVFLQHAGFFPVERVTVHPDYAFPDYDLAILRLAEPVTGIRPTPLPNATPANGTRGTLVGFGRSGGPLDDFALKRTTRIETEACASDLSAPLQLCWDFSNPIGEPGEDGNTCNGDSGGPLFVGLGLGTVVAGVTSGGTTPDCLPPDESWDTNVHHFVDYVRAQAGADLDSDWCGAVSQVGDAATTVEGFSGNLGLQDEQAAHTFDVAAGTSELRVTLNATEEPGADFDLIVRATGEPASAGYECARTGSGQWAACLFYEPPAGSWELLVQRVLGQGEYQVTASSFAAGVVPPVTGTPQSRAQQRCLKVQSKLGRKAAASEVRAVRRCLQALARGETSALGTGLQARTAQACLTNDVRGRVASVARKAAKKDEKVCTTEPPDFGYAGADAVVGAPIEQIAALVGDLFGSPVDTALVSRVTDAAGAACQQELARRVGGVYDAASLTALLEAKSALSAGVGTPDALASVLGSALLGDSRGKIRKARSKLQARLGKRCGSADLSSLFPGVCNASSDVAALADCAAERTLCRHCLAEELARGIDLDCDPLDDAMTNASCD